MSVKSRRWKTGVEEGDQRALADKALDHARADARAAAGDQHALALEAGINRPLITRERQGLGISFGHGGCEFL
jgi:hypothetical protein